VTPRILIERRDAHQTMHSGLGGEKAVRVFAFDFECHALDTGLFSRLVVDNLSLETTPFSPLQIHAQKHLGPVLGFRASGARMNRTNGVARIVLAAQQHLGFSFAQLGFEATKQTAQFIQRCFVFFSKFKEHAGVGNLSLELLLAFDDAFQTAPLLEELLRRFLI
jgi:hypothetical protein